MKSVIFFAILSFALCSTLSVAQQQHNHENELPATRAAIESLSPGLRELLKKEMLALQQGLQAVIPAYIAGDWHKLEGIALQMKNSYIMKQQLSDRQRTELHNSLPESFIQQDQRFHYLAGMLSHAAKNKKIELVGFYFSELSNSCVGCHAQFAAHRFPALATTAESPSHRH